VTELALVFCHVLEVYLAVDIKMVLFKCGWDSAGDLRKCFCKPVFETWFWHRPYWNYCRYICKNPMQNENICLEAGTRLAQAERLEISERKGDPGVG